MSTDREFCPKITDEVWARLEPRERALQVAADICDRLKVHEEGGNNHGRFVARILSSVGLGEGYAWCAAFVHFANVKAGIDLGPKLPAAVRNWATWAEATGRITNYPQRGDLFFWLNHDQTGHMGRIVRVVGPMVQTIEGNTSSGEAGSQRDGDGVFRRLRMKGSLRFISLA